MTLTGVDVSRWQSTSPPFANYGFMFARATYGTTTDSMFSRHIAAAQKARIVTGAYLFGYGSKVASPEAQADAFMRVALASGADIWAVDYEPSSSPMTSAEVRRIIARVHSRGYRIGLYASRSGFDFDLGQDFDWIADWDASVFPRYAEIWQYRGSPLDQDKFAGTVDQLLALAHVPSVSAGGNKESSMTDTTVTITAFPPRVFNSKDGLTVLRQFNAHNEVTPSIKTPYAASVDASVSISQSDDSVPHGSGFLRLASGGAAGRFILASEVDLAPVPPAKPPIDDTPFNQADIDAAHVGGVEDGKHELQQGIKTLLGIS